MPAQLLQPFLLPGPVFALQCRHGQEDASQADALKDTPYRRTL